MPNFPTSADDSTSLPNPTATSKTNSPSHSALHTAENAAIIAVEAKVGTGASTPTANKVLRSSGTGTSVWGQANLTTDVTGTLPVANGGTGITSLGTGVATFLGTPSSANLAAALTDETGTGSAVFGTSPSLTTPKVITAMNDTNGNELFKVTATASAVNEVTVANAATGNNPSLTATGGDTNVGLNLVSKGTGEVQINGVGISGAWTSWVPTLANLSGGTLTYATYKQIGKIVRFRFKYTLAGAGVGTAATFTLPVTAAAYGTDVVIGTGVAWDTSANTPYPFFPYLTSTTVCAFAAANASATYAVYNFTTTVIPFTWATGDFLFVTGEYEAA